MNKKMLFVFNPKAGKGKIKTNLLDIVDIFNKGGYEVIIYSTQKPKDAYEKAKEYESKVDLIVCSGGDGTLDEVVTGVMEKKSSIPIGYIPAGSTNDFANSLFYAEKHDRCRFHDHGRETFITVTSADSITRALHI